MSRYLHFGKNKNSKARQSVRIDLFFEEIPEKNVLYLHNKNTNYHI